MIAPSLRPEFTCDLPNRLSFGEAHCNHSPLVWRKVFDYSKEPGPFFNIFQSCLAGRFRWIFDQVFLCALFPVIINGIGCNAEQPSREADAAPIKGGQVGQRLVENVGGQVLGDLSFTNPARYKCIHPLKVVLVVLGET